MSDHPLSPISVADADATLVAAYRDDPVHRWLYPDDRAYANNMPPLISAVGGSSFERSTAWRLDGESAVALWVPPGVEPDPERIGAVLLETVAVPKHLETFDTLEQTDAVRPDYPHWYLPFFGVDPTRQNRGIGARLLAACLEVIDLGGAPAYLLASNPRNIPFFERFGFLHTGDAQAGSAPALSVMIREGRQS
jgi:GNAT superfamily N-acetyltransferase